jgi:HEAT repeat protein/outer membrane lipoprotein YfiO
MLKKLNTLLAALLMLLLIAAAAAAQQRRSFQQSSSSSNRGTAQQSGNDATTVFRSARDLITDGEWAKAQEKFQEYVSNYPNEKNIDAALYWLAYSENKLEKFKDCRATITRLLEKYPTSSWRDDARVLLAQSGGYMYTPTPGAYDPTVTTVRNAAAAKAVEAQVGYATTIAPAAPVAVVQGQGQGIGYGVAGAPVVWAADDLGEGGNDDDPCEFKIVVLQALFQTDVQRGIVAATEWLKPGSTQTVRCKSAALTLLGRHGGKTVTPVILGLARTEPDLKLRARAISVLGATNDDSVIDALRDFALTSQENDIVEASVYALSKHTGDRAIAVLSDIATSGKTTAQRRLAIASIATRPGEPAVDALLKIYDADQSVEIRRSVIAGFGNRKSERAGNKLVEIARSSDNVDLRKSAIGAISRRGGDKAVEFLLSLYDSEKNDVLKDQILSSLGSGTVIWAGNLNPGLATGGSNRLNDQRVVRKFIEIAKNQQEPMERRKRAIGWLSRSKDPEVLKFLEELLR